LICMEFLLGETKNNRQADPESSADWEAVLEKEPG